MTCKPLWAFPQLLPLQFNLLQIHFNTLTSIASSRISLWALGTTNPDLLPSHRATTPRVLNRDVKWCYKLTAVLKCCHRCQEWSQGLTHTVGVSGGPSVAIVLATSSEKYLRFQCCEKWIRLRYILELIALVSAQSYNITQGLGCIWLPL